MIVNGGRGESIPIVLPGEGCYDPLNPYGGALGDLHVNVRYPPSPVGGHTLRVVAGGGAAPIFSCAGLDAGPGAALGWLVGKHAASVADQEAMWADKDAAPAAENARCRPRGVCLLFLPDDARPAAPCVSSPDSPASNFSPGGRGSLSPAAKAAMAQASASWPGLVWRVVRIPCCGDAPDLLVMDDEEADCQTARVILVDFDSRGFSDPGRPDRVAQACEAAEFRICRAFTAFVRSGLDLVVCERWLSRSTVAATGDGAALLGLATSLARELQRRRAAVAGYDQAWPFPLIPRVLRCGGEADGYRSFAATVCVYNAEAQSMHMAADSGVSGPSESAASGGGAGLGFSEVAAVDQLLGSVVGIGSLDGLPEMLIAPALSALRDAASGRGLLSQDRFELDHEVLEASSGSFGAAACSCCRSC